MTSTINLYENAIISNDEKALQDIHLVSKNIAIYNRNISFLSQELNRVMEASIECRIYLSAKFC